MTKYLFLTLLFLQPALGFSWGEKKCSFDNIELTESYIRFIDCGLFGEETKHIPLQDIESMYVSSPTFFSGVVGVALLIGAFFGGWHKWWSISRWVWGFIGFFGLGLALEGFNEECCSLKIKTKKEETFTLSVKEGKKKKAMEMVDLFHKITLS